METEKWLHYHFASRRIRGEWFSYHDDMMTIEPPSTPDILTTRCPRLLLDGRISTMTNIDLLLSIRDLHLSQKEFAGIVGLRQEAISRYIRGHAPVPYVLEMAIDSLKNTEAAQ
jgi:hypothetical protein